ncbi:MAG TPA: HAD-IIA family hydrolase [Halobacteriales archaeon]|nr:HAD-IIA family hydrolase [Halobacteriales archaeon]
MGSPRYDGAVVDLDGTVYLGDRLIPGADGGVAALRDSGVSVLFVTNKAIERRAAYRDKLRRLGVQARTEDVMTSSAMTASYLAEHHPEAPIFVVGEAPLRRELTERNLRLTDDPDEAAVLLASMDRQFDYERLTDALHAMDDDTVFLATNPDRTCPTENGEIPDCGAVVGAIEGATGQELHGVIGKPSQTAIDAASSALDVAPERCLVIGDRLETDIRMGNRAGMTTVLVLSGVTDRETVERSSIRPDHVVDSLADVAEVLSA